MELVEGETLRRVLARGPMLPARVERLARQLVSGLIHAHERGVIHRDLKPDNILVSPGAAGELARIGDFGLALTREDDARLTQSGIVCTPAYAAPEQLLGGAIDHRADLYALGVTLFEMLSGGVMPFPDDPRARRQSRWRPCRRPSRLWCRMRSRPPARSRSRSRPRPPRCCPRRPPRYPHRCPRRPQSSCEPRRVAPRLGRRTRSSCSISRSRARCRVQSSSAPSRACCPSSTRATRRATSSPRGSRIDDSRRATDLHVAGPHCVSDALAHVRTEVAPDIGDATVSLRFR